MTPLLVAAVRMDRLFVVAFTPILVVILLRYTWLTWKYFKTRQQ